MRTFNASVNAQFGAALVVGPLNAPDHLGENPDWILDRLTQPAVLSSLVQDHLSALDDHVTARSSGGVQAAVSQGLTNLVDGLAGGATIGSQESAGPSQGGYSFDGEGGGTLSGSGYGALGFPDSGTGEPDTIEPDGGGTGAPSGAPTELLVQFAPGVSAAGMARAVSAVGGEIVETIHTSAMIAAGEGVLVRMTIGAGVGLEQAIQGISHRPGVEFAEPNWGVSVEAMTSDDPAYTGGKLWGMYGDTTSPANEYGSQAGEAWATGYVGSFKTVAGVVDTGIDYTHPDLYLNVWLNQNEIPEAFKNDLYHADSDGLITFWDLNHENNGSYVFDHNGNGYIDAGDLLADDRWANGINEDGNGDGNGNYYTDDLIGWDFVNNDNDPYDDHGHGTHVSGTIGGVGGNGTGVAGVAWDVQLMGLKFLNASGSGSLSNAIKALDYYTAAATLPSTQDFVATNNSWGGGGFSQALLDSIVRGADKDVLFVAAAGNGGRNGRGDDNDSTAHYPSNYDTTDWTIENYDAVIAVASITSSGSLSTFSNYGLETVDLGAPGQSIYSTLPGGYGTYSGTSMAAPHVTGAIALYAAAMNALSSGASALEIKNAILGATAPTDSLAGKTVTGGRLDAGMLMNGPDSATGPAAPVLLGVSPDTGISASDEITNETLLTISGTAEPGSEVKVYKGEELIKTLNVEASSLSGEWSFDLTLTEASYSFTATATINGETSAPSEALLVTVDTTVPDAPMNLDLADESDNVTSDTTPTITGKAEAGAKVELRHDLTDPVLGTAIANLEGIWTITTPELTDGEYSLTATATDVAGNPSPASAALVVTIDSTLEPTVNYVYGSDGSDTEVKGTPENDIISGLAKDSTTLGSGTVDIVFGDAGADVFVFGDLRGAYYDDAKGRPDNGTSDYGQINDFVSQEDRIQLFAGVTYVFAEMKRDGVSDTGIFIDFKGEGLLDSQDELIGVVAGLAPLSLNFEVDFFYVG